MNVNQLSLTELRKHPYRLLPGKGNQNYRRTHGSAESAEELRLLKDFPPAEIERIKPYLAHEGQKIACLQVCGFVKLHQTGVDKENTDWTDKTDGEQENREESSLQSSPAKLITHNFGTYHPRNRQVMNGPTA